MINKVLCLHGPEPRPMTPCQTLLDPNKTRFMRDTEYKGRKLDSRDTAEETWEWTTHEEVLGLKPNTLPDNRTLYLEGD